MRFYYPVRFNNVCKVNFMGFFDSFKKKATLDFTSSTEAITTLMLAISTLDGEIDESEMLALSAIININPTLNPQDVNDSLNFAIKYINRNSSAESAVDAFNFLDATLHGTAFSYACMVALADGVVTDDEENILMELAGISSLSEEETHAIISTSKLLMTPIS